MTKNGINDDHEKNDNGQNDDNHDDKWSLIHWNVLGFNSKRSSISAISQYYAPNVIIMNETLISGNKKPDIKGYFTYAKNRVEKSHGGISTSICKKEANDASIPNPH